jgi:hypothetical protein
MPWFDRANALKVIAWLNKDDSNSDPMAVFTWDGEILIMTETHDGTDYVDRMEPDPHGRYPIGAGAWVWDVVEVPEGEDLGPWLRRITEESNLQRDVSNLLLDRAQQTGDLDLSVLHRLRHIVSERAVTELGRLRPNNPHEELPQATIDLLTTIGTTDQAPERSRWTWAGLTDAERATVIDLVITRVTEPPIDLPDPGPQPAVWTIEGPGLQFLLAHLDPAARVNRIRLSFGEDGVMVQVDHWAWLPPLGTITTPAT